MATRQVDKLISKAAKEKLKPIGLFQVGTSRIWLDDNGWFITVVEYQPSSWSQGAYLNVGVSFLWEQNAEDGHKDVLAYDLGGRLHRHIEYKENDEQFYQELLDLSDIAIKEVKKFKSVLAVANEALSRLKNSATPLGVNTYWNIAMFYYLCGDILVGDEAMRQALTCAETEKEFCSGGKMHAREWVVHKMALAKEILATPNKQKYVLLSINEKRARLNQKAKYKKMLSRQFER